MTLKPFGYGAAAIILALAGCASTSSQRTSTASNASDAATTSSGTGTAGGGTAGNSGTAAGDAAGTGTPNATDQTAGQGSTVGQTAARPGGDSAAHGDSWQNRQDNPSQGDAMPPRSAETGGTGTTQVTTPNGDGTSSSNAGAAGTKPGTCADGTTNCSK